MSEQGQDVLHPRVSQAVDLADKIGNIFRARGRNTGGSAVVVPTDQEFQEVEEALGFALPADYRALVTTVGTGLWGIDPMPLMSPREILKTLTDLRKTYSSDEVSGGLTAKVELDWTKPNCFIPFASSSSAFYLGWIKTSPTYGSIAKGQEDVELESGSRDSNLNVAAVPEEAKGEDKISATTTNMWPVVQLDGEMSLARNTSDCHGIPLVELLYRTVVRAVTKEVWQSHGQKTCASYFWYDEPERLERGWTMYKLDGSQDLAESKNERIIVFGRAVFSDGYESESDEEEEDDNDQEQVSDGTTIVKRPEAGAPVFEGASEADFNTLGDFCLLHPVDLEIAEKQAELDSAERRLAVVGVSPKVASPSDSLEERVFAKSPEDFREHVMRVSAVRRRIAVSEGCAAVVLANGTLATGDQSCCTVPSLEQQYLFPAKRANEVLLGEEGETFVEVAMGQYHGLALTSQGRVLSWGFNRLGQCGRGRDGEETDEQGMKVQPFGFVSVQDVKGCSPEEGKTIVVVKLAAGECASAAILNNGKVLFWGQGHHYNVPGAQEPDDDHEASLCWEPTVVEGLKDAIDVAFGCDRMVILHADGAVSVRCKGKEPEMLSLPKPAVAIRAAGDHILLILSDGMLYGMGDNSSGAQPRRRTREDEAAIDKKVQDYEDELSSWKKEVSSHRRAIRDHCKSCPRASEPPAKQARSDPSDEALSGDDSEEEEDFPRFVDPTTVKGVRHTPDACGAPECPSVMFRPDAPPEVAEKKGHCGGGKPDLVEPALLTVGPEHGQAIKELHEGCKNPRAWDAISGSYGMEPGSASRVVDACGGWGYSVFLHEDGAISACGKGSNLSLGIIPAEDVPNYGRCSTHARDGTYIPCFKNVGSPLSATSLLPDGTKFVAVESNRAGTLAVQDDGTVWGCGNSVGLDSPTGVFTKVNILHKNSGD